MVAPGQLLVMRPEALRYQLEQKFQGVSFRRRWSQASQDCSTVGRAERKWPGRGERYWTTWRM
ncbi:hypothetical protein NRB20_61830 [Nocardia sp. RB20]|uniref:Uncharacterized protein n=1 Tax=Nocardia macrotermitis TaxID=2585198 RepID=A0A7K0DB87_9NOCA|nr:hypothetical protein [Nocardia macrotermitis]